MLLAAVLPVRPSRAQVGRLGQPIRYTGSGARHDIYRAVLTSGPEVTIDAAGLVTVAFETARATPPCALAYGVLLPEQEVRLPRFCRRVVERTAGAAATDRHHRIQIPLAALTEGPCDAYDEVAAAGGGTIHYELEIYDSYYDAQAALPFRFAFRDSVRVASVVDGPWIDIVSSEELILSWGTDFPVGGWLRYVLAATVGRAPATVPAGAAAGTPAGAPGRSGEIPFTPGRRQEVRLFGLAPGVRGEYWICLDDPRTAEPLCDGPYRFRMPAPDEPFLFAVMGDSQPGRGSGEERSNGVNLATLRLFCRDAHARGAHFILFLGDFGDGFTTSPTDMRYQWETWKQGAGVVGHRIPFYEIPGNHESCIHAFNDPNGRVYHDRAGAESVEAIFDSLFTNPRNGPPPESAGAPPYGSTAYSFRYGRSLFIGLNTFYWYSNYPEDYGGNLAGYIMDRQLAWLSDLLIAASTDPSVEHVFIFQHHPTFPCGGHVEDSMWYHGGSPQANQHHDGRPLDRRHVIDRRDAYWQALVGCGKVRAVFCGHEHNYSRLLVGPQTRVYPDRSANPSFDPPIWQCVSGGCGGAPYAESVLPWSEQLSAFSVQEHYLLIGVGGEEIALFAIDDGLLEFDSSILWAHGQPSGEPAALSDWLTR